MIAKIIGVSFGGAPTVQARRIVHYYQSRQLF
jgi:hypothetical protein